MDLHIKSIDSILVKPAGPDCNLACTYCFYREKSKLFPEEKVHRMNDDTLEALIRQVMLESGGQASFSWQGGEPTLMGLPFFERAVTLQQQFGRGQNVDNGFQTNGILVNKKWAQFFNTYRFLVGLSLDGPQHVHDKYRLIRGDKGSWQTVVNKAKLLLDSGVEVNALTVVNDYSVGFVEEIYEFHKSIGLNFMQFIPCVETDSKDPKRATPFSVSSEKYGVFLRKLFDLWMADFKNGLPTTSIRFFESIFFYYVGLQPPDCNLHKECGIYVVVEHNGDVYSCDFFVEPVWKLGNIKKDKISDMLNSRKQKKFGRAKSDLPKTCRKCEWLLLCRGGCVKDRIRDPRDKNLNHFCRSYKSFFSYADRHMKELAEQWKERQKNN